MEIAPSCTVCTYVLVVVVFAEVGDWIVFN